MTAREIRWTRYRLRTCNSLHCCNICGRDIVIGNRYRDGGYGRRAHEVCASRLQALHDETAGLPAGVAHVHVEKPEERSYAEDAAEVLRELPTWGDEEPVEMRVGALRVLLERARKAAG